MTETNKFGQLIGRGLSGWTPPQPLPHVPLEGKHVLLRPLVETDAGAIYQAFTDAPDSDYTYMGFEPFQSAGDVTDLITSMNAQPDWLPYAIEVGSRLEGFASYLRLNPGDGVVEIGSIMFSLRLKQTTAATEAIYLMMSHAIQSGYRRLEWKCDSLNEPSRIAGKRLGFRYEGTFLNATHYKGRNRDTAWFSMTVGAWEKEKDVLETWLDPSNFDADGTQVQSLTSVRGI